MAVNWHIHYTVGLPRFRFFSVQFYFLMSVFGYFGSVQATVYCLYFTSKTCSHNVNLYIFSTTNIKNNKMATRKSNCSQMGDLNLQEGAVFSRSLNDNRRMIMTGLYFVRFSSQNVCFNSVYSKKKTQT